MLEELEKGFQPLETRHMCRLEESITSGMLKRALPASFDARTEWPHCSEIIGRIHNQGQCGSCWAFAATSALDSRLCIATEGVFTGPAAQISRGYVTSCAKPNGGDGCAGGHSSYVFDLMASGGSPTGGNQGCSPYFGHGEGTEHFDQSGTAPPCPTICGNTAFGRSIQDDTFKLGTSNYIQIASFLHPHPTLVPLDLEISGLPLESLKVSAGEGGDHERGAYSGLHVRG